MNSLKFNKYEIILLKHYYKINLLNNINKLDEFIKNLYLIKSCERENNGEVLTPVWLVNQMLDKLEKFYPGIFKSKNLKYFDHSAGVGIFFIELYKRLINNGIKKDYILKNMLYFSEYNKKNVFILKMIFGKNANINEGDTLKLNTVEKWGINKFDIILGNPPYNSGGIKTWKGDKLSKTEKNKTIWPDFINYSLNHLNNNGYLISINPLTWIKSSSKEHTLLKYQIHYLELWDSSYAKQKINAEIPLSWFILQNKKYCNKTLIKSCDQRHNIFNTETYKIDYNKNLPFVYFSIFDKLYNFTKKYGKFEVLNKKINGNGEKIEINKINKNNLDNYGIDTYLLNKGIMMKKINKKDIIEEHKKYKLIFANKTTLKNSIIDNIGYNICGNDNLYILDIDNLDLLHNYFNSKIINFIVINCKYRGQFIEKLIFDYIPDIRNINELKNKYDENKLYKLIGLTKEEINIINKF